MKNKDHPTSQQRIVVASCITVSPSGECKLSVDAGDRQTDGQASSPLELPFLHHAVGGFNKILN